MLKLSEEELTDFRVPLNVFKQNCRLLAKAKPFVKDRILRALGVDTGAKDQKVDWVTYLQMH